MDNGREYREKRGSALLDLFLQDVQDNMPRYAKVREHRALYDGSISSSIPIPWEGASQINVPLIMSTTDTILPMVMSGFMGVDPIVNVKRSASEFFEQQTDDVQQYLNFVLTKDIPGFYETCEMWFHDCILDGMSYVKPYYVKSYRRVSEVHTLKILYDIGAVDASGGQVTEAREKMALELLVDLFGPPSPMHGLADAYPDIPVAEGQSYENYQAMVADIESTPASKLHGQRWVARFIEDRQEYMATVRFKTADHIDEILAIVGRDIIDQDCCHVDLIDYEDVVLPFRSKDVQSADRATQRFWMTVDEIKEKKEKGEWILDDDDLDIISRHDYRTQEIGQESGLAQQRDNMVGEANTGGQNSIVAKPDGFLEYNRGKVLCLEMYLKDDLGEGIREEAIHTIIVPLRKIVNTERLDEIFPHGRRPLIPAKYKPVGNRNYALGIGDQLAPINMEVNAIVNLINNNQELINNPWFFYEPASFTTGPVQMAPGQGLPVNSVQGIRFPQFTVTPLSDMSMMSTMLMFADRMTVSPLSGGSSQMKNAPRTARGTASLLSEGHVKVDMFITRLQETSWKELIEQIFGLYKEMGPEEKWYWITRGNEEHRLRMTRQQMRGRYEFTFSGNTVNTNREILRTIAQVRYNTLISHPDYASDPQARQNLRLDLLKFWGDGASDIKRLVPSLPGQGSYTHPPMRQQEENKAIELGAHIEVLPSDNHAEHLAVMDQAEGGKPFAMMPEHSVGLWAAHKRQHMQFLQQQSQQPNYPAGGGQANNVPVGETMANMDQGNGGLGALEGGVQ